MVFEDSCEMVINGSMKEITQFMNFFWKPQAIHWQADKMREPNTIADLSHWV